MIVQTLASTINVAPYIGIEKVYDMTGSMMRFCVLLAGLEIVHVQLKLVKGSILPTTAQVCVLCIICVCTCR